ncbi:alpha/beta fold hydrolase [Halostagnicola kamekurae]|uniref:Pimeloyl-ACP methyl ester carboxylesterase n=1 Tax=Halostagnicola kamekurae TaxID=619731 RepID=A0A1I6P7N9_9EURY|nr:alpha/beta hydrolase [Halostagnicola kamekurae]SFS36207.1 Pimeloyl-ACP methyl ester carboxylesterase [Halostagnicola kamekurae]
MPTASNGDTSLHYELDGDGYRDSADGAPDTVVFVPEVGLGGWSWGWQHAALSGPFETLVWDLRGTGRSDAPPGPYDLETLASDLEAVLADADVRSAHVVGAGLGGAVALEAARATNRVETLALLGTAPTASAFALEPLFAPPDDREAIRSSLETVLSVDFRSRQPDVLEGIVDWRADGDAPRAGWEAQLAALSGFDASDWLVELTQPALVLHGADDELVDPDAGERLARGLPRGEFERIEAAGHLAFIERSRTVNDRLLGFLESQQEETG